MGVVKDQSGEPLPGAVVYVKSKSSLSVVWVWSPKNLLSPDKNLR